MTLQRNKDRIQTTHVGSLPRPRAVLDLMKTKYSGGAFDRKAFDAAVTDGVHEIVRMQAECGIDIVTDGEISKSGFFTYVRERFEGFEPRQGLKLNLFVKEISAFPEYYEDYFKSAMMGGAVVPMAPVVCVGPVKYRGHEAVQTDIRNLKAAAKAAGIPDERLFLPATAPAGVGINEHYKTEEEYLYAVAAALNEEYRAIVGAGLLLQVDDPFMSDIFVEPELDRAQMERRAALFVDVLNEALKGVPWQRVRYHTCYGINHGPRVYESALADVMGHVLKINAGSFSFEAANPRHEHEYHLFETVKPPDGKVLCPGVITHASNIVEHPELIAERIVRFAKLVGRENVMAGADCGFSSQALYKTEVHPLVIWEKFKALRAGADIATRMLWSQRAGAKI